MMFNFIVTGDDSAWFAQDGVYNFRSERLFEHTRESIKEKYTNNIDALSELPCIFTHEEGKKFFVGSIVFLDKNKGDIRVRYKIEHEIPAIWPENNNDTKSSALIHELDISELEKHRTHWAVKDGNLDEIIKKFDLISSSTEGERWAFFGELQNPREDEECLYIISHHGEERKIKKTSYGEQYIKNLKNKIDSLINHSVDFRTADGWSKEVWFNDIRKSADSQISLSNQYLISPRQHAEQLLAEPKISSVALESMVENFSEWIKAKDNQLHDEEKEELTKIYNLLQAMLDIINAQEKKIDELEKKINELEKKIEQLRKEEPTLREMFKESVVKGAGDQLGRWGVIAIFALGGFLAREIIF